jgi:hypothetical protein
MRYTYFEETIYPSENNHKEYANNSNRAKNEANIIFHYYVNIFYLIPKVSYFKNKISVLV